MVSHNFRSRALFAVVVAVSCAVDSGGGHRTGTRGHSGIVQAADAAGSTPASRQSRYSDLTNLQIYEKVKASVPEDVRELATTTFEHAVEGDDALREFQSLRRRAATSELRGLIPAQLEVLGATSHMFAGWSRLRAGAVESPQELDTNESPCSGPDGEVLLHSGELRFQQIDHSLPSRSGLGFTFARIYRSHVDYDGPLGPGWNHNHNHRLVVDGDSPVTAKRVAWYTGQRRVLFYRQGDGWLAEKGAFYRLFFNNTQAVIETPTLNRLMFERAQAQKPGSQRWRIKTVATRHDAWRANTLRYTYDNDRLSSVVDPFGNDIRFHYDRDGRLCELRHGTLVVRYGYDGEGRLNSVTTLAVARSVEESSDLEWAFEYDQFPSESPRSWLVGTVPPGGGPKKVINYERVAASPDFGWVREIRFCKDGLSKESLAAWKFDRLHDAGDISCTVRVTPPLPLPVETFTYRTTEGQARLCERLPIARAVPARKAAWTLNYNEDGLLKEEKLPLGGSRQLEYDSGNPNPLFRGNLLSEREYARPGQNVGGLAEIGTGRKYHPKIALPVEENAYEIGVDGTRRLLRSTRRDYDERDLVLTCTRIGKHCSIHIRNRFGLVVAAFDGLGVATLYRYFEEFDDGAIGVTRGGLLAECVRDIAPERVHAELRMAGIAPSKMVQVPQRTISTAPLARSTRYTYSANGLPIREQHEGYEVHSLFNKVNLLLCRYDTREDLVVLEYDAWLRKATEYRRMTFLPHAEYKGEVRLGIKGRFYKQRFTYDGMGNLACWVPTEEHLGLGAKAPPVVKYTRYTSGLLRTRTPPGGNTVELVYDEATGHLRKKTLASNLASSKRLILQTDLSYDAEGFQDSLVDDLGQKHSFKPDSFGRPFSYTSPDGIEQQTFLDGLGRPVRRTKVKMLNQEPITISESTVAYDAEGNLELERTRRLGNGVDANGNDVPIDEWLVTGQFRYDSAGNRTHARSVRDDAWTHLGYDGLRRVVLTETPEGDSETVLYANDQPVLRSHHLKNQTMGQIVRICDVAVLDAKYRPWLLVRVGNDGIPAFSRAVVQAHDSRARRVQSTTPGLMRRTTVLDSLDRVVREVSTPLTARYGEETKIVTNQYDPDGHVLMRTVQNSPMAVFTSRQKATGPGESGQGSEAHVEALRVLVPQNTVQEYDEFGRLWKTKMPDGLVRTNGYNAGSMVDTVTSTHLENKDFRHVVRLEYDSVRRIRRVSDESRTSIQSFGYDDFRNVIHGEDRGNPQWPVTVKRRFDNLGNILYETTLSEGGPKEVGAAYEHLLAKGTRRLSLLGLNGQRAALWQQMAFHTDRAGRTANVGVDSDSTFCQYSYVGSQVIRKSLAEGGTDLRIDTTPLLEPVDYSLYELSSQAIVCRTNYHLNSRGLVDASSAEVPQMQWQRSHFYQHDSQCTLIAELAEDRRCSDLEDRRKTVMNDLTCPSAWRVRWSRYDEVGNLTTTFRKRFSPTTEGNQDNSTSALLSDVHYYSPGQPVHLALPNAGDVTATWEQAVKAGREEASKQRDLTSNRLATVASRHRIVQEFDFDELGRLIKFPSLTDDRKLTWDVEYDLLGRVMQMRGYGPGKEKPEIELQFASDVFNRRTVKQVQDYVHLDTSVTVTTYVGGEPVIVMERGGDKEASWDVAAQYLWGPAPREIIMAVLPADKVEQRQTQEWGRYYLHQDRMLNVFLCTGLKKGKVEVFDIASFWGFGENSTTGNLASISSTASKEHGTDPNLAIDKILDNERGSWLGGNASDRITLGLNRTAEMSEMTIWTGNFPKSFRVYVVPDGKDANPSREELSKWEANAQANGWMVCQSDQPQRQHDIQDPYRIPLLGREGKSIVVAWDKATSLSVREFEVSIVPRNPSCLAFAGQWLDKETGLYYQGARYRLPRMGGKFICPDPLGFLDGDNLYAYAHNNPLTWHDPDGQYAHILIGGGVGAVLGAGGYGLQVWMTGEEFSWGKLGIYTLAGGASGALTAATFGAASAYLGTGLAADFLAGGAAGGVGGVAHGLIASGGATWLDTGSFSQGAVAGLRAAALEGAMGFAGGGLGGAALGQLSRGPALNFIGNKAARGLTTSVFAGGVGGAGAGAVGGGYEGYMDAGWEGVLAGSTRGAGRGAVVGAAGGALVFGIGKSIDIARGGTPKSRWGAARRGHWRTEAQSAHDDPGQFSPEQIGKMEQGRAPTRINPVTGGTERMEFHHQIPQRSGLPGSIINKPWNLRPVWPDEHSAIDPFRH